MKFLIVRFSSIGDIVLTSPVVRCLREQTGGEVHLLTKKSFTPIVAENPHLGRVYSIEKDVWEVLADLKSESYDAVIDLHHNLRSIMVRRELGGASRVFQKENMKKWGMVNLKAKLECRHIVERYLESVRDFGAENDGRGLDFFISKKDVITPGSIDSGLSPGNYVAFVIGAAHATKRLAEERMVEICHRLSSNHGLKAVLLGGLSESEVGKRMAEKTGAVNACGRLNLGQSACLVREAGAVLTHDTGLMHIAAAFQKRMVSVWGSTVPAFGMSPYFGEGGVGRNVSIEIAGLGCRPCSKIGFDRCPRGHFRCMAEQPVEKITEILAEMML